MRKTLLVPVIVFGVIAVGGAPDAVFADSWTPRASDRLMKLPGNFLEKAVDNDFNKSELAAELARADEKVSLKMETLGDLQAAIGTAEDDARLELEYQLLTEKKRYLELMREQQEMRRKRAQTKVLLYEQILRKLSAKQAAATPAQATLLNNQQAARERFEASLQSVDTKLFRSSVTAGSRYGQEYAKNVTAIENLVQAINAHPMNQAPELNGRPMTQADYLRHLIAQNEAEVALVDQEKAILGYMAKLVSLDALALSEGMTDTAAIDAATPEPRDRTAAAAVDLFMPR